MFIRIILYLKNILKIQYDFSYSVNVKEIIMLLCFEMQFMFNKSSQIILKKLITKFVKHYQNFLFTNSDLNFYCALPYYCGI